MVAGRAQHPLRFGAGVRRDRRPRQGPEGARRRAVRGRLVAGRPACRRRERGERPRPDHRCGRAERLHRRRGRRHAHGARAPAWSSKNQVAYLEDQDLAIYTFGARPATRNLGIESQGGLEWSPDGRLLAYESNGSNWVYDTKGKDSWQLIGNASEPAFSPDGRRIAYVRALTVVNTEIFIARSGGSSEHRIPRNPGTDVSPRWQPAPSSARSPTVVRRRRGRSRRVPGGRVEEALTPARP